MSATIGSIIKYLATDFLRDDLSNLSELCHWPPDLFAVVSRLIKRSNVYLLLVNQQCQLRIDPSKAKFIGDIWSKDFDENNPPLAILGWWHFLCDNRDVEINMLAECASCFSSSIYVADVAKHELSIKLIEVMFMLLSASDTAMAGVGHQGAEYNTENEERLLRTAVEQFSKRNEDGTICSFSLCKNIDNNKKIGASKIINATDRYKHSFTFASLGGLPSRRSKCILAAVCHEKPKE